MNKTKYFAFIFLIFYTQSLILGQNNTGHKFSSLFEEINEIVDSNFYSTNIIKNVFPGIKKKYLSLLENIKTEEEFSDLIKSMLEELKTSHTQYYTTNDFEYYHLASIFYFRPEIKKLFDKEEITYPSLGIFTEVISGKIFIVSILSGGPADLSGLKIGDEIVSVDSLPYSSIKSIKNKIGKTTILKIRRVENGKIYEIPIIPKSVNPKQEFFNAQEASVKVIEELGKKIAYVHIWSYAGKEYHDAFLEMLTTEKIKNCDALIWDLRFGWGGAGTDYLLPFTNSVPSLTLITRDSVVLDYSSRWKKPVVMLTDKTVRSGKELLAFGFKNYGLGTIIGEKTAGSTTAGKLFVLSNKSILYLAVMDTKVDGVRLEGRGVEPHIKIKNFYQYCDGKDNQLQAAIEFLTQ